MLKWYRFNVVKKYDAIKEIEIENLFRICYPKIMELDKHQYVLFRNKNCSFICVYQILWILYNSPEVLNWHSSRIHLCTFQLREFTRHRLTVSYRLSSMLLCIRMKCRCGFVLVRNLNIINCWWNQSKIHDHQWDFLSPQWCRLCFYFQLHSLSFFASMALYVPDLSILCSISTVALAVAFALKMKNIIKT